MPSVNYLESGTSTGFPYVIIDDLYDEKELGVIWRDLEYLQPKLLSPEQTAAATGDDGNYIKNNKGIFIPDMMELYWVGTKVFQDDLKLLRQHDNWFFKNIKIVQDSMLVSYYEDGDYYAPHVDSGAITCLTWFYKEPKSFEGGNLCFPEYDFCVDIKPNRMLAFPACLYHEVPKVTMNDCGKGLGRYCVSQFLLNLRSVEGV